MTPFQTMESAIDWASWNCSGRKVYVLVMVNKMMRWGLGSYPAKFELCNYSASMVPDFQPRHY